MYTSSLYTADLHGGLSELKIKELLLYLIMSLDIFVTIHSNLPVGK